MCKFILQEKTQVESSQMFPNTWVSKVSKPSGVSHNVLQDSVHLLLLTKSLRLTGLLCSHRTCTAGRQPCAAGEGDTNRAASHKVSRKHQQKKLAYLITPEISVIISVKPEGQELGMTPQVHTGVLRFKC